MAEVENDNIDSLLDSTLGDQLVSDRLAYTEYKQALTLSNRNRVLTYSRYPEVARFLAASLLNFVGGETLKTEAVLISVLNTLQSLESKYNTDFKVLAFYTLRRAGVQFVYSDPPWIFLRGREETKGLRVLFDLALKSGGDQADAFLAEHYLRPQSPSLSPDDFQYIVDYAYPDSIRDSELVKYFNQYLIGVGIMFYVRVYDTNLRLLRLKEFKLSQLQTELAPYTVPGTGRGRPTQFLRIWSSNPSRFYVASVVRRPYSPRDALRFLRVRDVTESQNTSTYELLLPSVPVAQLDAGGLDGMERANIERKFNRFTGFAVPYDPNFIVDRDLLQPIIYHIWTVFCSQNTTSFSYMLNLLASIVANPESRSMKCLVLAGDPGAGKTLFVEWFGKRIIGPDNFASLADFSQYFASEDSWTSSFADKLFTVFNDVPQLSRQSHKRFNRFKPFITDSEVRWSAPHMGSYNVTNFNNFVLTSNYLNCVNVEPNDRRFFVLKVDSSSLGPNRSQGHTDYFRNLRACLDDPNTAVHFFHCLLNGYSQFPGQCGTSVADYLSCIPLTEGLMELRAIDAGQAGVLIQYLVHHKGRLWSTNDVTLNLTQLYQLYREVCTATHLIASYTLEQLEKAVDQEFDQFRRQDTRPALYDLSFHRKQYLIEKLEGIGRNHALI